MKENTLNRNNNEVTSYRVLSRNLHSSQLSKQNNPLVLLLTLVVIILLTICGYLGYNLYTLKNQKTENVPETFSAKTKPTKIHDALPDWIKYRNDKYGFELSYPANSRIVPDEALFKIFISGNEFPTGCYVSVDVLPNPKNLSLKKLGNQKYFTDSDQTSELNWQPTTFLGSTGITVSHTPPGDSGPQEITIFSKNNHIFSLVKSYIDETNSTKFMNIATEIISTFYFIPDMSDWNIYTDRGNKFLFKYPKNWIRRGSLLTIEQGCEKLMDECVSNPPSQFKNPESDCSFELAHCADQSLSIEIYDKSPGIQLIKQLPQKYQVYDKETTSMLPPDLVSISSVSYLYYGMYYDRLVLIPLNNKIISLYFSNISNVYSDIDSQILNSFKLLE